jgi:hypothetical protein
MVAGGSLEKGEPLSHKTRIRHFPLVCLVIAVALTLLGRLRLRYQFVGRVIEMENDRRFRIFRHLSLRSSSGIAPAVLVVRFRFARFSQRVNRLLSLLPIPLIGGFPGFREKLWMVDEDTGDWQGVYEWESAEAVEAYRRSFVLGVMNRRADPGSITYTVIPETRLADYLAGWVV